MTAREVRSHVEERNASRAGKGNAGRAAHSNAAGRRSNRHSRWERLASAHADGELGPRARKALEAHLHGCPRCRRALAAFAALNGALEQALAAPPPSPQLLLGLTRALEAVPAPRGAAPPGALLPPGPVPAGEGWTARLRRALGAALRPLLSPALRPALTHAFLAAAGAAAFALALEMGSAALRAGGPGAASAAVAAARAAVTSLPPDQAAGLLGRGFSSLTGWLLGLAGQLAALGGGP